tara:strand:+ start:789 stop:1688 length:900 start_codon:yes stop_codon:yes gene_type:complete
MAKLNVDEIEANGTNSNVKVVAKGVDGACEIKGATNDAILQLNCSAQSHGVKLQSPNDAAGQNYTMILPDNQIAANKFLKVKSITGSGATGVGQLEYGDAPTAAVTDMNATNITSGTMPSARFDAFSASDGAGLVLVNKATVSADNTITIIDFDLEDNTLYRLVGKNITLSANNDNIKFEWLDSSDQVQTNIINTNYRFNSAYVYSENESYVIPWDDQNAMGTKFSFEATISTKAYFNYMILHHYAPGYNGNYCDSYSMFDHESTNGETKSISKIRLKTNNSNYYQSNTQLVLYKYNES